MYLRVTMMKDDGQREDYAVKKDCLDAFVEAAECQDDRRIKYIGYYDSDEDFDAFPAGMVRKITEYEIGFGLDVRDLEGNLKVCFIPSHLLAKVLSGIDPDYSVRFNGLTCKCWVDELSDESVPTQYYSIMDLFE